MPPEGYFKHWLLKRQPPSWPCGNGQFQLHAGARRSLKSDVEERVSPLPLQRRQWCRGAVARVLSLDNSNRPQFNGLLADASIMAGVHHIGHVLIGLRSLQGRSEK